MQANVIGLGQEFIQCDHFGPVMGGHIRIICNDVHAQGMRAYGNFMPNVAIANDAESFAADLISGEGLSCPIFRLSL